MRTTVPRTYRSYTSRRCAMRMTLMSFTASSMMYTTRQHLPGWATDLCSLSDFCILRVVGYRPVPESYDLSWQTEHRPAHPILRRLSDFQRVLKHVSDCASGGSHGTARREFPFPCGAIPKSARPKNPLTSRRIFSGRFGRPPCGLSHRLRTEFRS